MSKVEEPLVELRNEFKDGEYVVTQFEDVPETHKIVVMVRDVETGEKHIGYAYIPDSVDTAKGLYQQICGYILQNIEKAKIYPVK